MTDTATMPAVNTLVSCVSSAWEGEVASRIEDIDGQALVLAAPFDPADEVPRILRPPVGTAVRIRWTHPRGMSELRVEVHGIELRPTPQWQVRPVEPVNHIQRRENVRVLVLMQLQLRLDEVSFRATTVDVSEGGLRCIVPARDTFAPGERVDVVLDVEGESVPASAELLRTRKTQDGHTEVTARFLGMNKADANRVRKFLFAEQVAQRARERDRA